MPDSESSPVRLTRLERSTAGVAAAALGVAAVTLLYQPVRVRAAAPECAGAPSGCVIEVDEAINFAVPLALCAVASLFLLIAITGRLWQVTIGENVLKPEVTPVTSTQAEAGADTQAVIEQNDQLTPEQRYAGLLDRDRSVAYALNDTWQKWYGQSVANVVQEVRRETGQGNHAWFVRATDPDGNDEWVRIGKGGGGVTTRLHQR